MNQAALNQNRFYSANSFSRLRCSDIGAFPDQYSCKMRYSVAGTLLGSGSTTSVSTSFYINGPGSLSHTPKGWDVLKAVYERFYVIGSSARITVTNLSTTLPVKVYVCPVDNDYFAAITTTLTDFAESDGCITRQLGVASGGHDVAIMNYPYTKISALAGLNHDVNPDNDDFIGYTGSANASTSYQLPVNTYVFGIAAFSLNGTSIASNSLTLTFEMDMDVVFLNKLPAY